MSFGTMIVGGAMAIAGLAALSGQAGLANFSDYGASGTVAWADDQGVTRDGGAGALTQAAMGVGSIPEGRHSDTFLDVAYSDVRGFLLFNFAITDVGPVVFRAPDTLTDAPGLPSGTDGTVTVSAAPELTTWTTLALAMAPLGAAARVRRRWVAHPMAL